MIPMQLAYITWSLPPGAYPPDKPPKMNRRPICVTMECAKCESRIFFCFLHKDGLIKIGQFPSFASLRTRDIKKYKNLIPKFYLELQTSLNAFSQGMGIGAFVYLRRIIESLVDKKYKQYVDTNYKRTPGNKLIDRLKEVEKHEQIIPDEIKEAKN